MTKMTGKLTSTKTRVHVLTGLCDQTIMRTLYKDEAGNLFVKAIKVGIGPFDDYELVRYAGDHCGYAKRGWYEFPVYSSYPGDWI